MNSISRETFDDMSIKSKLGTLFDNDQEIYAVLQKLQEKKAMSEMRHKGIAIVASGICSFLGGVSAVWAYMKFLTP